MAMEITGSYSSYAAQAQYMAENRITDSAKKKEADKTSQTADSSRPKSTAEYAKELAKLVPSVEFRVGTSFAAGRTGKTLTVDPRLLAKMQNDPEKEKEMKELIKGVESMTRLTESINKASGWKTVFRHSYIDENGKYCHIALVRNEHGYKMSEKLRRERWENSEKLIQKQKENAAEKKKELKKMMEEKKGAKAGKTSARDKVKQMLDKKMAGSQNGRIYVDDADFKAIMKAVSEQHAGQSGRKKQVQTGANLDLTV